MVLFLIGEPEIFSVPVKLGDIFTLVRYTAKSGDNLFLMLSPDSIDASTRCKC